MHKCNEINTLLHKGMPAGREAERVSLEEKPLGYFRLLLPTVLQRIEEDAKASALHAPNRIEMLD